MLWLSAGAAFILAYLVHRVTKSYEGKKQWLKLVPFSITAVGIFALSMAPLPFGAGSVAALAALIAIWPLKLLAALFGVSVGKIAAILLIGVIGAGLIDLWKDKKPDEWAKTMLFAVPVLVLIATGPVVNPVKDVIETIGGVGPSVVAKVT